MHFKFLHHTFSAQALRKYCLIFCCTALTSFAWAADPIWHCSRSVPTGADKSNSHSKSKESPTFDLSDSSTIEVLPIDLFHIYSGGTVLFGSKPLTACFIDRNHALTIQAMSMLDIEPSSLNSLAKIDSIVQSKIFPIRNQEQMKACIAKNHPALGYLSEVVESDQIGPCF